MKNLAFWISCIATIVIVGAVDRLGPRHPTVTRSAPQFDCEATLEKIERRANTMIDNSERLDGEDITLYEYRKRAELNYEVVNGYVNDMYSNNCDNLEQAQEYLVIFAKANEL